MRLGEQNKTGRCGTLLERFNKKYMPEPNSGCWLWTGALSAYRYGAIGAGKLCKLKRANRVSWQLFKGKIPAGLNVLHKCDTPLCVNPDHLFLGTQEDNVHDMENKKRGYHKKGSAHSGAKLIEAEVLAIRKTGAKNVTEENKLARQYSVL